MINHETYQTQKTFLTSPPILIFRPPDFSITWILLQYDSGKPRGVAQPITDLTLTKYSYFIG